MVGLFYGFTITDNSLHRDEMLVWT